MFLTLTICQLALNWKVESRRLQTTAREGILPTKENNYIYEKFIDLVECNISRNNHIT